MYCMGSDYCTKRKLILLFNILNAVCIKYTIFLLPVACPMESGTQPQFHWTNGNGSGIRWLPVVLIVYTWQPYSISKSSCYLKKSVASALHLSTLPLSFPYLPPLRIFLLDVGNDVMFSEKSHSPFEKSAQAHTQAKEKKI